MTVNACDPLNLTGVVIRGARTPAVRTNTVTYVDGAPEGTPGTDGPPARPPGREPAGARRGADIRESPGPDHPIPA